MNLISTSCVASLFENLLFWREKIDLFFTYFFSQNTFSKKERKLGPCVGEAFGTKLLSIETRSYSVLGHRGNAALVNWSQGP